MQKNPPKLSPSPDRQRKKSGGPDIEPFQHLSNTARVPAAEAKCILRASPEPGMAGVPSFAPQEVRLGQSFGHGRASGSDVCIPVPITEPQKY